MYKHLLRPLLFLLPAETAHRWVLLALGLSARVPFLLELLRWLRGKPPSNLSVRAFGHRLESPLGLAAGLDKDATAFRAFLALGFGFVEVGTVTAHAQPGNPRPRLFRLPLDRALINRMGFNNDGALATATRLSHRSPGAFALGVNIGRSKVVPNDRAVADYAECARLLAPHADYLVLNVSSPNTPELRALQQTDSLAALVKAVRDSVNRAASDRRVPLLVKLAPDLSDEQIDAIADLALKLELDGIIATNTTTSREGLVTPPALVDRCGAGGLSGKPLKERALQVLSRLRARVGDRLLLVAVGGVGSAEDVWQRLCAGASLVQLYTALIYEGPGLIRQIHGELSERVRAAGLGSISELCGRSDLA